MSQNILVTGGAGFIGSNIVDFLISKGHHVIVLDDLSAGKRSNVNEKANFVLCNVLNIKNPMKIFRDIDAVIHCAAQISVINSVKKPVNDALNNIIGTLNVLEMCRKFDVKKFIFSSSGGAMYDNDIKQLPFSEKLSEVPQSPYAIAKRSSELYMDFYRKTYGIECISMRYSNVFGPRQDHLGEAGVVAIFINKLLKGERPIIFGDGIQTRDFIYVDDVAEANLTAITKKTSSKEFNIGTGVQTSINHLLYKIKLLMGIKNLQPIYKNPRLGEIKFSCLDISRAKKELGWQPKISLEEGLRRTIGWFANQNLSNKEVFNYGKIMYQPTQ